MHEEIRLNAPEPEKDVVLLCPNCHEPMVEGYYQSAVCPNACVPIWAAPECSRTEDSNAV